MVVDVVVGAELIAYGRIYEHCKQYGTALQLGFPSGETHFTSRLPKNVPFSLFDCSGMSDIS